MIDSIPEIVITGEIKHKLLKMKKNLLSRSLVSQVDHKRSTEWNKPFLLDFYKKEKKRLRLEDEERKKFMQQSQEKKESSRKRRNSIFGALSPKIWTQEVKIYGD